MSRKIQLSAELDTGCSIETYDVLSSKVDLGKNATDKLMSKSVLNSNFINKSEVPAYELSKRQEKLHRREERGKTKGKEWFNMNLGEMTEEAKNDLLLIKMRGGLHKDRFYKHNDSDELPKFFQMGKVIDDPVDFYSDRVPKKQQKRTILEELIEDAKVKKFAKKHYSAIQTREEHRRKKLSQIFKNKKQSKNKIKK
ncbi:deoxynucleotidyltransferase terminal-interacting 2 [Brachionus plicatilis]|uniref:Deoxynucleotidyltransferase terminal-interacting 2 n=1 Tax=Brachionus plicatilis TaxID=10195 RepID=A0A3M7SL45_BRAPC|nr:deoxynucleotidyltransferase terminal-interacting 2 [Brachionus plicatilis]